MTPQPSPLDRDDVREHIRRLNSREISHRGIAEFLTEYLGYPVSHQSVGRAIERMEREEGSETEVKIEGDEATINVDPVINQVPDMITDPEEFLREHGLNPDEWEVTGQSIRRWNPTPDTILYYQSVNLKRLQSESSIIIPRLEGWTPPDPDAVTYGDSNDSRLVVFCGDQQAPFHDEKLHELFCAWLDENRPDEGVLIGDTVDFPDISRHRFNPENTATFNECLESGVRILRDYVASSQGTNWVKLAGNHDERVRNTLLDLAPRLYGARRPGDEHDLFSIPHILRLDELGIEFVDPKGEYAQGQVRVSDHLAARHGWIAKKGSGASALATLEHLGYSVVIGHTHRQSLVYKTTHDIDGNTSTLAAAETGCMCKIDGLGYAVAPDWQQGFATATIWDDGKFRIDHATFVNGSLLWRDQCYE